MTVAVCLNCGALKHGAWTLCARCSHLPETLEDQAKHFIVTDHHQSREDLEAIGARIESGLPVGFDQEQVTQIVADLEKEKNKFSHFSLGFFVYGIVLVLILGVIAALFGTVRLVVWLLTPG